MHIIGAADSKMCCNLNSCVQAVRHAKTVKKDIQRLQKCSTEDLAKYAAEERVELELVQQVCFTCRPCAALRDLDGRWSQQASCQW